MEKNSTLENNLKKYTALASGLTAMVGGLNAQVVYTNVDPDETVSSAGQTQAAVDFNGDNVIDVAFVAGTGSFSGTTYGYAYTAFQDAVQVVFTSSANATNGWLGSSSSANNPMALSAGQAIGAGSVNFMGAQANMAGVLDVSYPASTTYNYNTNIGEFTAGSDQYLGVRFDISGSAHYGWVRVEVGSDGTSMTIKDFAYDATAGTTINAGDVGSGPFTSVEEEVSNVSVRTLGNNLRIELDNYTDAEVKITNLAGEIVFSSAITSNVEMIGTNEYATGIYLVNVQTSKGLTTKKVYIK